MRRPVRARPAAIAVGRVLADATGAQRRAGLALAGDLEVATQEQWTAGYRFRGGVVRHRLAGDVVRVRAQRAGRAASDNIDDAGGLVAVRQDPRAPLAIEH